MPKVLKSAKSTLTYEDAEAMTDEAITALLFDLNLLSKEATDDEDEQANIQINIASKVKAVVNASTMKGALMGIEKYVEVSGLGEMGASVEEA